MFRELLIRNLYSLLPFYFLKIIIKQKIVMFLIKRNFLICHFFTLLSFLRSFLVHQLVDIVGIDTFFVSNRFSVVYNVLSLRRYFRLFIQSFTDETLVSNNNKHQHFYSKEISNSVYGFYSLIHTAFKNYGWLEREVWDMFGIFFFNNLDLRRILTDYGFEGFPLRKDFPLTGFLELRYDEELKSVVYEDLELTQEFRFFDFESPWKRKDRTFN